MVYCFSVFDCLVKSSVLSGEKRKPTNQKNALWAHISEHSIAIATSSETGGFKDNLSEDGQLNEMA